jgi:hypothetical protein
LEKVFPIAFNVATLAPADGGRFAARLIGSNAVAKPVRYVEAAASAITQALTPAETSLFAALAPLAGETPRAVKRFLNACRVTRTASAPRPAVALMLATRLGGDRAALVAMRQALDGVAHDLLDPSGPPALVVATQAARAANDGLISLADARAAWEIARRYSLPD